MVINVQRFAATGLLTVFSGAGQTIGFDKNPLSFLFSKKIPHIVGNRHEIERNQALIAALTDDRPAKPRLYPSLADEEKVRPYKTKPYITVSPASVWFTKQYPKEKWSAFLRQVPEGIHHLPARRANRQTPVRTNRSRTPGVRSISAARLASFNPPP